MDIKEALELVNALERRKESDKGLQDLLNEVSAAQSEIVERVLGMLDQQANAMTAKDIAGAVSVAVSESISKAMRSIELKPQFDINMPEANHKTGAKVVFQCAPNGNVLACDITFRYD